jgi:mono/diheme cytochrome c family protein
MKKALKFFALFAGMVFGFLLYLQCTYRQTYQAPVTGLQASTDPAIIARGQYLAMGPAHCWTCHVEDPAKVDFRQGPPAMSGGMALELPLMVSLRTPNITPDKKTGIGRYTDEQLAQTLRYNVTPRGHALIPYMGFNSMSDTDLVAILSYLRAARPVEKAIPAHEFTMLGKMLMRFAIKPDLSGSHKAFAATQPDTTAAYGKYLAYSVANCNGCHTQRGPTGAFTGKPFAGGNKKEVKPATFVVPNLTPDPATGRIYHWSQQAFIARFRAGKAYPEEFMPWNAYQHMSDNDLKAIYNFLQTLEPVQNKVETIYVTAAGTDPKPEKANF